MTGTANKQFAAPAQPRAAATAITSRFLAAYTPDGNWFYSYDGQPSAHCARDGRTSRSERAQRAAAGGEAATSGNVTTLVSTADGTVSATYDYSPFGLTVSQSGPAAQSNVYRFSPKPLDETQWKCPKVC